MAIALSNKLAEFIDKEIVISTTAGEGGEKSVLLEVGTDYVIVNPSTAWDDDVVRVIPFTSIDHIDIAIHEGD